MSTPVSSTVVVHCPVCGKEWNAPADALEVQCNCHLYCVDGSEPADCTLTAVSFTGQVGWPFGQHGAVDSGCDNVLERTLYCSVHGKYSNKRPVIIDVVVPAVRVKKAYRMSEGNY